MKNTLPVLGFIGTGTLTEALVTGFCSRAKNTPYPIVVSPRNKEKSKQLHETYPERVTIAKSMQEVVDSSDWIMLAVLPEAGEQVCRSLSFRPEQKIVNLMFDKTAEQIESWINCKPSKLLHALPSTFNAFTNGPIIVCPPDPEAEEIFGKIGEPVPVESRYDAAVLSAVTSSVTPLFAIMDTLTDWAQSKGVPAEKAAHYVTSFFTAVCLESLRKDREGIHSMASSGTPGGINLQNLELINAAGGIKAWADSINPIFARTVENITENGMPAL